MSINSKRMVVPVVFVQSEPDSRSKAPPKLYQGGTKRLDCALRRHRDLLTVSLPHGLGSPLSAPLDSLRMVKEVASYEKEAKDNEARVQKMRDDGKDPYDIKKQEEVGCL